MHCHFFSVIFCAIHILHPTKRVHGFQSFRDASFWVRSKYAVKRWGWTVADVQHWLGHTDIETTFNIYVAYGRGRKIALGGSLAGLFDRVPEKPETPDK